MNFIVIGSGITGSNVALALLEKGYNVELWDVGKKEKLNNLNNDNFYDFKKDIKNSVKNLIGDQNKNFVSPYNQKLFEIPPLRNFLLNKKEINNEINKLNDFDIYQSFNKGGLANGWGANCIPYNQNEIIDWHINHDQFFLSQKKNI